MNVDQGSHLKGLTIMILVNFDGMIVRAGLLWREAQDAKTHG